MLFCVVKIPVAGEREKEAAEAREIIPKENKKQTIINNNRFIKVKSIFVCNPSFDSDIKYKIKYRGGCLVYIIAELVKFSHIKLVFINSYFVILKTGLKAGFLILVARRGIEPLLPE